MWNKKEAVILAVFSLLLAVYFVFVAIDISSANNNDYYFFIGKQVKVCLISECYTGVVDDIIEIDICKQKEPLTGICIDKKEYYTMFLKQENGKIKSINCDLINSIEEIK